MNTSDRERKLRRKAKVMRKNTVKESTSDYQDFMDDCMNMFDEETCQFMWEEAEGDY